jgi:ferric-dicitrate binding protein FerR (iron transport regulator)
MSNTKSLIQQFVDDRDSLSEDQLQLLVEQLEENAQHAIELKEQLILNELVSQRLGIDRNDFLAQMQQRVRDCDAGEEVLTEQIESLRSIADEELRSWNARAERARFTRVVGALAALLLVAISVGLWYWMTRSVSSVAVVVAVRDGGALTRDQSTHSVSVGTDVLPGDRYQTTAGQMLKFRYTDGTVLQVGGNSIVRFPLTSKRQGKNVIVLRGDVSADVAPQASEQPMVLQSPLADATVVGTSLTLSVRRDVTWLDVTEGKVRLSRRGNNESEVLVEASQFGVVTRESVTKQSCNWPVNRKGMLFAFQTADKPNLALDPITQVWQRSTVKPRGDVRYSDAATMRLVNGMFVATGADKAIVMSCRQSNELSIQATIRPDRLEQSGPARIISLSSGEPSYNFVISQTQDQLVARLRSSAGPVELNLGGITTGEPTTILLTFKPGRLVCHINGDKIVDRNDVGGDLSNWVGQTLVFGNEVDGTLPWSGSIEGIAIFNRFLDDDEAKANVAEYRRLLIARESTQTN